MKVSILGAGYVGAVSGACLTKMGHEVILADLNADKVARIGAGESPIVEAQLPELLKEGVESGRLTATTDVRAAVLATDASIVCVGTPSREDGSLNLQYVRDVSETIGKAIAEKSTRHTVIMRSTMVPGSMKKVVIPTIEEHSGLKAQEGFGLAIYPEFLREGTAIRDFFEAAITLYGADDDQTIAAMREINAELKSREVVTSVDVAEAVKYANNCWHAVKVSFANEVGNISRAAGIDGTEVMEILCLDDRLNISPAYLRPGFAYGGSCLPKDLRALRALAAEMDVPTPMFDATIAANEIQIEQGAALAKATGEKAIGQIGLTFKDGTDDLRESPLTILADKLIASGLDMRFYDSNIEEALQKDEFRRYFSAAYPEIYARLVDSPAALLEHASAVIVGRSDPAVMPHMDGILSEKKVVDLVRIRAGMRTGGNYAGICW